MALTKSSLATDVWTRRELGLELSENTQVVTHDSIEYLCNYVFPFFQLIDISSPSKSKGYPVKLIKALTGWIIHDYGDAISTSAPHNNGTNSGVAAQVATVVEVADIITKKGWDTVELIAGTPLMNRMLKYLSGVNGFTLAGYTYNEEDEKCYERLIKYPLLGELSLQKSGLLKLKHGK